MKMRKKYLATEEVKALNGRDEHFQKAEAYNFGFLSLHKCNNIANLQKTSRHKRDNKAPCPRRTFVGVILRLFGLHPGSIPECGRNIAAIRRFAQLRKAGTREENCFGLDNTCRILFYNFRLPIMIDNGSIRSHVAQGDTHFTNWNYRYHSTTINVHLFFSQWQIVGRPRLRKFVNENLVHSFNRKSSDFASKIERSHTIILQQLI